jgi:hypothetical protein
MTRWFRVYAVSQIERFLQSKCARPTAVVLALFLLIPNRRAGTGFTLPVALCRARALEIAQTAQRMIARRKIALISLSINRNDYATA